MVDFYVVIIKRLFALNPKILFSDELKFLKLTNQYVNKLRAAKSINASYFIETHSSNVGKFNNIKRALKLYELEDELFIKYQD